MNITQALLLLTPMVLPGSMAMDLYLPAVSDMPTSLGTTASMIQWTMSIFLIAQGTGQLLLGPVVDRWGRRLTALIAMMLFGVSSVFCAQAAHVESLIFWRAWQAVGACGTQIAAFAIVRDCFTGLDRERLFRYLAGSVALAPVLAPVFGSFLSDAYGWRSCFWGLAVFAGVVFLILYKSLPETISAPLPISSFFQSVSSILSHKEFLAYSICAGVGVGAFFTFFSVSPVVLRGVLGLNSLQYATCFGGCSLWFMMFSFLIPKIFPNLETFPAVLTGSRFVLVGGFLMGMTHWVSGPSVVGTILPMLVVMIGASFILGSAIAGAMADFPDSAGTAAALYGLIQLCFASCAGQLAMIWPVSSTLPLALVLVLIGTIGWKACCLLKKSYLSDDLKKATL
ncbi:MAG: multidrug effflux MFS transporter [Oligoflexales bacterium]